MILLQYDCGNKIWAMKTPLDMLVWKGKNLTEPRSFDKEYKKLMICKKGRISLPREEAPN